MKFMQQFCVTFLLLGGLQGSFEGQLLAAGGDVLWEQQLEIGWYNVASGALVNGNRLILSGITVRNDEPPSSNGGWSQDGLIAAYDVSAGVLLWSDTTGLKYPLWEGAFALGVSSQHVFAAFSSQYVYQTDGPGRSFHRKYDPLNGSLVWERPVGNPRPDQWVDVSSLATTGSMFFLSGAAGPFSYTYPNPSPRAVIRAYRSAGGALLWEAKDPPSSRAGASVASGNRLFVVLSVGGSQFVRAYDVATGAKVWQKSIGSGKSVSLIKVNGNQLFLAGTVDDGSGGTDSWVQSLRTGTGALLWQDTRHNPGSDFTSNIAIEAGKVFVCGSQTNAAGNQDFLVRAYDALTGRLVWESLVDKGGRDVATAIAVNPSTGMVFAVGWGQTAVVTGQGQHVNLSRYLVRAYNMDSGALAWEHFADDGSSTGQFATGAVVAGESLLTMGGRYFFFGEDCGGGWQCQDLLIRAYDAR